MKLIKARYPYECDYYLITFKEWKEMNLPAYDDWGICWDEVWTKYKVKGRGKYNN